MMRYFAINKFLKCCKTKRPLSSNNKVVPVLTVEQNDDSHHQPPPTPLNSDGADNSNCDQRTSVQHSKKNTSLRFGKVISGIKGAETKKIDELKEGIKIQAKSLARFLSLFVLYSVTGGIVFLYIEECSGFGHANDSSVPEVGDKEVPATYKNVTASCWLLYTKLLNSSTTNTPLTTQTFEQFFVFCKEVIEQSAEPYIKSGKDPPKCVWNEFTILKYAEYTIFTLLTIGYGNTTPITVVGRTLAIIYAIGGVPIAVTMYSIAGKLLVQLLTLAVKCFNAKVMKRNYRKKTIKMQTFLFSVVCVILIMLIGCGITTREEMENWEFSSSFYFWFISLTTIGYGDLHFDRDRHLANIHFLLIAASLLLFGLGMVAAVIESFAVFLEKQSLDDEEEALEEESTCTLRGLHLGKRLVMSTAQTGCGILLDGMQGCEEDGKAVRFEDNIAYEEDQVDSAKANYYILREDELPENSEELNRSSSTVMEFSTDTNDDDGLALVEEV